VPEKELRVLRHEPDALAQLIQIDGCGRCPL
jgi:hypothetical protein